MQFCAPTDNRTSRRSEFCGIVGRSPAMQAVFGLIERLAPCANVVLISGETGTGKELVARAFHQMGPRRSNAFVTVDCAALVDAFFESEFIGHLHDAIESGQGERPGLFDAARGGTIFLDEVAGLPLAVQARLVRALESCDRLGTDASHLAPHDVAIVAATSRDLREEVAAGRFRADLFYRLNVGVVLPPLRDRREDIPLLVASFARDCARRLHRTPPDLAPSLERRLTDAPWHGNVRELKNAIERACLLSDQGPISERAFGSLLPPAPLQDIERRHILDVLRRVGGNRVAAARLLGISRRSLYRRLERHGITTLDALPPPGRRPS